MATQKDDNKHFEIRYKQSNSVINLLSPAQSVALLKISKALSMRDNNRQSSMNLKTSKFNQKRVDFWR
jgi:hypothetical protein